MNRCVVCHKTRISVILLLIFQSRLVTAIQVIVGGHVFAAGLATYFGNETWYDKYLMPALLRLTSPETGHRLAVKAAHYGIMPRIKPACHPELVCIILSLEFLYRLKYTSCMQLEEHLSCQLVFYS